MRKLCIFFGFKRNLVTFLTQWYFLYKIQREKHNSLILFLCKCIIPKRKRLLDKCIGGIGENWGAERDLDLKMVQEFGIAKQWLENWAYVPEFDDRLLEVLPDILNMISASNSDLKKIGDKMFSVAKSFEKEISSNQGHLVRSAVIAYQRAGCKEGIEKCADWLWGNRHEEYYPQDLYFKTNLYIEVGAFDKIKKILGEARVSWGGKDAYSEYVNFYEELINDLQGKSKIQVGCLR